MDHEKTKTTTTNCLKEKQEVLDGKQQSTVWNACTQVGVVASLKEQSDE